MVLASYVPVASLLKKQNVGIVIISTSSPKYSTKFASSLGFELPGIVAVDTKRQTHKACGLKSSVFASLIMPFRKHLATFGTRALAEALRVSLMNATAGHGSSWQQGATFVVKHPGGVSGSKLPTCTMAWREDFPGDWQPVHTLLDTALGIKDAPVVSYPERLDFVIACRNGKNDGKRPADGAPEAAPGPSSKKRKVGGGGGEECTEEACSIDMVRRRSEAAMEKKV